MSTANELWLEDMSLKLLCVFALDRFGDFVTDEVGPLFLECYFYEADLNVFLFNASGRCTSA